MKILPPTPENIHKAVVILKNGGVVAHATETCYGLACDLSNLEAVKKVFAIKKRSPDFPLSGLFESVAQAKEYAEWNEKAEELANEDLPGPLTIILKLKPDAPRQLFLRPHDLTLVSRSLGEGWTSRFPTIGIRISPHPVALSLVRKFGSPISTTSANMSGQPSPYSVEEIVDQGVKTDLILDSGKLPQAKPSRIIDCTAGDTRIIRE